MRWIPLPLSLAGVYLLLLLNSCMSQGNSDSPRSILDQQVKSVLAPSPTTDPFNLPEPVAKVIVTEFKTEDTPDPDVLTITKTSYVNTNGSPVKPPTSNPDQGIETLKNAGIGLGVVIVIALIGIFILRKWKFSPTSRFRQKLASAEGIRQRTNESDTVFLRDLHAP
ncbi:hypothetical protein DSO57_1016231 [Entomophthora muscae]|uniref:Uncharacterized protein n=1 Tax=Entomophthora muscae TaxID=34485 RepID=A0ACC2RJP7_9FUNG|nr:hypothetical protein DSO57_1016231 [Entomophthora muscae]